MSTTTKTTSYPKYFQGTLASTSPQPTMQNLPFQTNPIMSYGIIAFNEEGKLLCVRRLYSIGYCEFINQCKIIKSAHDNPASPSLIVRFIHFRRVFAQMTFLEKQLILSENPEGILDIIPSLRLELQRSIRFDPNYQEPEWGFPKGRKNSKEEAVRCAMREFVEETGLSLKTSTSKYDQKPIHVFHEVFMGSNFRIYQHQYYLMPS